MRIEDVAEWEYVKKESGYELYIRYVKLVATGRKGYMFHITNGGDMSTGFVEDTRSRAFHKGLSQLHKMSINFEADMEMYEKL